MYVAISGAVYDSMGGPVEGVRMAVWTFGDWCGDIDGDYEPDGDVDLRDFSIWQNCDSYTCELELWPYMCRQMTGPL